MIRGKSSKTVTSGSTKTVRKPWRALLASILLGLFIGGMSLVEPLELAIKVVRNKVHDFPASGEIVLVAIDDRSLAEAGPAPWNGTQLATLLDQTRRAGARSIHLDAELPNGASPHADRLEAALQAAQGKISLPARFSLDANSGSRTDLLPPARFARHAELVNANFRQNWDGSVWHHPYGVPGDRPMPSLASRLGGREGGAGELFPINYGINTSTIPVVSASDVLSGIASQQLAGRDAVIARTDVGVKRYWAPGHDFVPAGMLHILAAETLRQGRPLYFGWLSPLAIGGLLAGILLFNRRRWAAGLVLGGTSLGVVAAPMLLEGAQIHVEVLPAFCVVLIAAAIRGVASFRRSFHERGTTNLVTGLPNLQALRDMPGLDSSILIVARVKNYAQIAATLEAKHEKEMVEQIVARLSFGTGGSLIYQSDEGVFVWVSDESGEELVVQQLEALHALFRTPIVVATRLIDLAVTFGLDLDTSRPLVQRVPSALIAADGAAREGKRWASFNRASLEDAEWAMSLLARLDQAIENEELWVAFQPKLDCRTGDITGAEALVRWTHPERGNVYPDQFIGAVEQGGRIDRLTYFVLDKALEAAAQINREGRHFTIAVNLSVLLLTDDKLVDNVDALIRKHGIQPELLTLEVTETSTLGDAEEALETLQRIANRGINLSIDDYGTGFSTLEYLKRIPASELKIDRSFISMLHKSQSDRIMVNSTIQLAHSLGRTVVAEGVENEEILNELVEMRCDLVQGYHIARPGPLSQLLQLLNEHKGSRQAA